VTLLSQISDITAVSTKSGRPHIPNNWRLITVFFDR
jgi:hypothetical protein